MSVGTVFRRSEQNPFRCPALGPSAACPARVFRRFAIFELNWNFGLGDPESVSLEMFRDILQIEPGKKRNLQGIVLIADDW